MSRHQIRENKKCLNCGAFVGEKFCPKCGQKNSESRESFYQLFVEFVADFVHYDSSFWKTTRYLLFSPAKLSLEYMEGKRKSYVNPVKLYIFISFIAFFIPSILPTPAKDSEDNKWKVGVTFNDDETGDTIATLNLNTLQPSDIIDSIVYEERLGYDSGLKEKSDYRSARSVAELDSIYHSKPKNERISIFKYWGYKFALMSINNINDSHKAEKLSEFIVHNLPKVLFIYMPIFAFWLWLFHSKKKFFYFDSGIFTLHFFSFWLLMITLFNILSCVLEDWLGLDFLVSLLLFLGLLYITFYFFRANRLFYKEGRAVSNVKAFFLVVINTILILFMLTAYTIFAIVQVYI